MSDTVSQALESPEKFAEFLDEVSKGIAPLAVIRQHAVGHGGFHTGALGVKGPLVRWVYDCGSWRKGGKATLKSKINDFAALIGRAGEVDLLFLSHFDADHVSGVRQLLRRVRVATVIVPYLEPEEAFGVVAGAAAMGVARRDVMSLGQSLLAPGEWFGDRGVKTVVRLRAGPSIVDGPVEAEPGAVRPTEGRALRVALVDAEGVPLNQSADGGHVIDAEPGLIGHVVTRGGERTDWRFVPFTHPVSSGARQRLRDAAETLLGVGMQDARFSTRLIELISEQRGIKRLRDIYVERELSDANAKSLSLYVGSEHEVLRRSLVSSRRNGGPTGWLLTGDAKLRSPDRRAAWLRHFADRERHVGYLMLPHHGAAGNFHCDVPKLAPFAQLFVTADEKDEGMRPHEDVRAEMREADDRREIARVTETPASEILAVSGASEFAGDLVVRARRYASWT